MERLALGSAPASGSPSASRAFHFPQEKTHTCKGQGGPPAGKCGKKGVNRRILHGFEAQDLMKLRAQLVLSGLGLILNLHGCEDPQATVTVVRRVEGVFLQSQTPGSSLNLPAFQEACEPGLSATGNTTNEASFIGILDACQRARLTNAVASKRISRSGQELWLRQFNGPLCEGSPTYQQNLSLDSEGRGFLCQYQDGGIDFAPGIYTFKKAEVIVVEEYNTTDCDSNHLLRASFLEAGVCLPFTTSITGLGSSKALCSAPGQMTMKLYPDADCQGAEVQWTSLSEEQMVALGNTSWDGLSSCTAVGTHQSAKVALGC